MAESSPESVLQVVGRHPPDVVVDDEHCVRRDDVPRPEPVEEGVLLGEDEVDGLSLHFRQGESSLIWRVGHVVPYDYEL